MDMYLGTDSSKDDPWFGTGPLKQNINRQQGIHTTNEDWSPYWSYVYVYCDESKVPSKPEKPKTPQCNSPNTPGKGVMAYTFPDDGTIFGWNAKYVVFCPRFFQTDILSLDAATTAAKANKTMQGVMDPWRKVHARSFFHETYHWGPAEVSDPIANRKPEIYDPAAVVALASKENIAGESSLISQVSGTKGSFGANRPPSEMLFLALHFEVLSWDLQVPTGPFISMFHVTLEIQMGGPEGIDDLLPTRNLNCQATLQTPVSHAKVTFVTH